VEGTGRQDSQLAALDVIDEWVVVSDKDAMQMARRLSKEEGLFVGGSTGVKRRSCVGRRAAGWTIRRRWW